MEQKYQSNSDNNNDDDNVDEGLYFASLIRCLVYSILNPILGLFIYDLLAGLEIDLDGDY